MSDELRHLGLIEQLKAIAKDNRASQHQRRKRAAETPEERATRLQKAREYTSQNRETVNKKFAERRRAKKRRAILMFGDKCQDCSNTYPMQVYDFHHLDGSTKTEILSLMFTYSWEKIEDELKKCAMLCANCHRIRHSDDG
jgi:5-methylcytosine-specific restriction endonuclease McrA